jgi:hypothetical protein
MCRERVFIALCKWVNVCSFCARALIVACDECVRDKGRSVPLVLFGTICASGECVFVVCADTHSGLWRVRT